jgi:hypothetical protein
MMSLIAIESYRTLFANEAAMAQFADVLEKATAEDDTPLVTFKERHIATALSPAATERVLSDRILQRFVKRPELLESFVQRLRDLKETDLVDLVPIREPHEIAQLREASPLAVRFSDEQ